MATNATVYVLCDTKTHLLTCTGGNTPANDGTVEVDFGPNNTIRYVPTGSNTRDWYLTGITFDPDDPAVLTWAWENGVKNVTVVVTDNDAIPANRAAISYDATLAVFVITTGRTINIDPAIVNKPASGGAQQMMSING